MAAAGSVRDVTEERIQKGVETVAMETRLLTLVMDESGSKGSTRGFQAKTPAPNSNTAGLNLKTVQRRDS